MTTKTKSRALDKVAGTMRSIVANGALYAHQRLERGLEIVLLRKVEQDGKQRWRLALGRMGVAASNDEIAVCREAFGVPAGTEHEVFKKQRAGKTGLNTWYIVEMYWFEN